MHVIVICRIVGDTSFFQCELHKSIFERCPGFWNFNEGVEVYETSGRIRSCLSQLNQSDITNDEKQELDEALYREV